MPELELSVGGNMQKLIALVLLVAGSSAVAMASPAPEIDPASGANALALIAGGLVILRSCRKK
jgi:hypothetical protein